MNGRGDKHQATMVLDQMQGVQSEMRQMIGEIHWR